MSDSSSTMRLLEALRERCAKEGDYEARSSRKLGENEGARFSEYVAKHIREIDLDAFVREFGEHNQ